MLLLLGLRWLPKRVPFAGPGPARAALPRRVRDLALAVAAGSVLAASVLCGHDAARFPETISRYFVEQAYPRGGTNVVNVILVDFRGFDTLVEITVLAVVAIAVYALLRRFRPARESADAAPAEGAERRRQRRGSAGPGGDHAPCFSGDLHARHLPAAPRPQPSPGGFVAGITLAIAVIPQYMAGSTRWVESRLAIRPARWMGTGLAVAAPPAPARGCSGTRSHLAQYARLPPSAVPSVLLRPGRVLARRRRNGADPHRPRASVVASLVELIRLLGIGVLAGLGVWLLLRPRTFQVIMGLSLLSYAVNLFIFFMGCGGGARRSAGAAVDFGRFADPLPQALVLTAIVIAFATTALLLVVLPCARPDRHRPRGRTGVRRMSWSEHLIAVPVVLPLASGALMLLLDEQRRALERPSA